MKNTMILNNKYNLGTLLALIIFLFLCVGNSKAQVSWGERPALEFTGQYDIRMVSGQVLQTAFVSSAEGQPYSVIRPLTDKEMQSLGTYLGENNYLSRSCSDPCGTTNNGTTASAGGSRYLDIAGVHSTFPSLALIPSGAGDSKYEISRAQVYADCDDVNTTFQSSCALLDFGDDAACTSVKAAYLYWQGSVSTDGTPTQYAPYPGIATMKSYIGNPNRNVINNYKNILFKAPTDANYSPVSASRILALAANDNEYVCFADVTSLVKGKPGGLYWVANVSSDSYNNGGAAAGWTLIVIFTPPNCPHRVIKFWDGFTGASSDEGKPIPFTFSAGQVPASGNSVSYLGYITTDAEGNATNLAATSTALPLSTNYYLKFQSLPGGTVKNINPYVTDQPLDTVYTVQSSLPLVASYYPSGMANSMITNYNPVTDLNGNQTIRRPNQKNVAGYGAQQIKLPSGSMVANATAATMTMPDDATGTYNTYMQFMAIQTLEPDLRLTKKAESLSTAPNGTMTYDLVVKNVGPLASSAIGTVIQDTLDKTINFVPGSVAFYDKNGNVLTTNVSVTVNNLGANNIAGSSTRESLTFTLPALAAGNGTIANDSITIKFKVQVQPLTRTDIWSYGCNRYVRNRAALTYMVDGSSVSIGSNSTASCSGQGTYYTTPVVDATLEAQYQASHNLTDTLTTQVNAANQAGTKLYIVTAIKKMLATQLSSLGLTVSDTAKYIVYDSNDAAVPTSAYFTQANAVQKYSATADYGSGCEETYNFTIVVAKIPAYAISSHHAPNCFKGSDGYFNVTVSDGTPGYSCKVYDKSNNLVYFANQSSTTDPATFKVDGLPAGKYQIVVGDQGVLTNSGYYTLLDTTDLTVSLGKDISLCAGSGTNLTAGTPGLNYVWKEKVLSATSWTTRTETTQLISLTPTETSDYIVYACNGSCQATDTVRVTVNPIPTVKLNSDTTVSTTINPTVTYHARTQHVKGTPNFTWEMSTDNGSTWSSISPRVGESYTKVNDSTYSITGLDTLMSGYQYRVKVKDTSTTCESSIASVTLTVTQGPKVTAESTKPSCFGLGDGKLAIHIKGGEPGETYTVTFTGPSNAVLPLTFNYQAGPTGMADKDITGPAGSYTVVLTPDPSGPYPGLQTQTKYFTIEDQAPVSLTLSSDNYEVCAGNNINLTANLTGGPDGGAKTYKWERSIDNGNSYKEIPGATGSSIPFPLNESSIFKVTGMVGTCDTTSNTVAVAALPTPKASIVAVTDTGCYSFDLHNLQVVETTGINDYTVTLHSAAPKNTNDNRYLIPESDYIVTKNMTVYARLTVGGLCSSTAAGNIYIKKMDQCYPISVPEFFSPDGDGINDLFQIDNLQAYDNPEIVIYDRYGKQLFKGGKEALTPPNGWDGKYLGKDLPSADYWYEMKFKEIKTKVGHFSIKRRKE
jgi:gliding motility-associated-like protein/uncharacterized repeat protein (TIGR01451 family)